MKKQFVAVCISICEYLGTIRWVAGGDGDQEDRSSKPAQANSFWDPILKKLITKKRTGGVAQSVGSEFKPQYLQKKKKIRPADTMRQSGANTYRLNHCQWTISKNSDLFVTRIQGGRLLSLVLGLSDKQITVSKV
jgi:hypothetical protein